MSFTMKALSAIPAGEAPHTPVPHQRGVALTARMPGATPLFTPLVRHGTLGFFTPSVPHREGGFFTRPSWPAARKKGRSLPSYLSLREGSEPTRSGGPF